MRRAVFTFAAAIAAAGPAIAGNMLSVTLDEVRLLAFAKPISTLYVADPAIADVTMIDKRHGFVLGKSFGTTNIIALDATGREVSNSHVVVSGAGGAVVTLHKGVLQFTYNCASGRCEITPQPGDAKDAFDADMDQVQKHEELSQRSASGAPQ
jgi:fucose permease